MPSSVNIQIVAGHLGRAPEIKSIQTKAGEPMKIASFSIATNDNPKKDEATGEWTSDTNWHRVNAFGWAAEKIERAQLGPGGWVQVIGKHESKKYTDKDGNEKYSHDLAVDKVLVIIPKGGKQDSPEAAKFGPAAPDLPW